MAEVSTLMARRLNRSIWYSTKKETSRVPINTPSVRAKSVTATRASIGHSDPHRPDLIMRSKESQVISPPQQQEGIPTASPANFLASAERAAERIKVTRITLRNNTPRPPDSGLRCPSAPSGMVEIRVKKRSRCSHRPSPFSPYCNEVALTSASLATDLGTQFASKYRASKYARRPHCGLCRTHRLIFQHASTAEWKAACSFQPRNEHRFIERAISHIEYFRFVPELVGPYERGP